MRAAPRVIFGIVFALATTGAMSRADAAGSDKAPRRHHEPWGGYSIELPDGWEAVYPRDEPLAALLRPGKEQGDRDPILIDRLFTADSHGKQARRVLDAILTESPDFVVDFAIDEFRTTSGLAGTRILLSTRAKDKAVNRAGLFYIEYGEVLYGLTWYGPPLSAPSRDDEIAAIIRSFRIEDPEPSEKIADGRRRYGEPRGGYSCIPPRGWRVAAMPNEGFRGFTSSDEPDDLRVLNVGRNGVKGTLDEFADAFLKRYEPLFGSVKLLDRTNFRTDEDLEGRRLTLLVERKRDGAMLRSVVYLIFAEGGTIECQGVGPAENGDKFDADYDAFARSLRPERTSADKRNK